MLRRHEIVKELKQKEKQRKRDKIVLRLTKLKEDREQSKIKMREFWRNTVDPEPLFLKKQKQFESFEHQKEEQRKQAELKQRKEMFKRISISEIRMHAKLHDKVINQKQHVSVTKPINLSHHVIGIV